MDKYKKFINKLPKGVELTDEEVQELRNKAKAYRDKGGDYLTPMATKQ